MSPLSFHCILLSLYMESLCLNSFSSFLLVKSHLSCILQFKNYLKEVCLIISLEQIFCLRIQNEKSVFSSCESFPLLTVCVSSLTIWFMAGQYLSSLHDYKVCERKLLWVFLHCFVLHVEHAANTEVVLLREWVIHYDEFVQTCSFLSHRGNEKKETKHNTWKVSLKSVTFTLLSS